MSCLGACAGAGRPPSGGARAHSPARSGSPSRMGSPRTPPGRGRPQAPRRLAGAGPSTSGGGEVIEEVVEETVFETFQEDDGEDREKVLADDLSRVHAARKKLIYDIYMKLLVHI